MVLGRARGGTRYRGRFRAPEFSVGLRADLGWHLAQGRENVAGRLVRTNVFSFTYPDYRQHYTSWLSDTSAYVAWRVGGDAAIQALEAVTVAATLLLVYLACRVQSAALPSVAVLILGFFVLEPRVIPRPHLVSFAGIAACSWLIERARARRSERPLLWAIPMFGLWSNLHIECIFGVLQIGLFALAELAWPSALTRRDAARALAIAVGSAAALLVNPYGWGLFAYVDENASVPRFSASPSSGQPTCQPIARSSSTLPSPLCFCCPCLVVSRRRRRS